MIPAKHLIDKDGTHSPSCFPCKIKTVGIAPSAMGTRFPTAARAKVGDPKLDKDREAYRRLRRDGVQPKHVGDSAHFEAHATEAFEIETGQVVEDHKVRNKLAAAFAGMPATGATALPAEVGAELRERLVK